MPELAFAPASFARAWASLTTLSQTLGFRDEAKIVSALFSHLKPGCNVLRDHQLPAFDQSKGTETTHWGRQSMWAQAVLSALGHPARIKFKAAARFLFEWCLAMLQYR